MRRASSRRTPDDRPGGTLASWRPGLLERVVRRQPLDSQGKSGSKLERGWLDDGSTVVIKHVDAAQDWIMQATGDDGRVATLWAGGVFQRLPRVVDHAMLDVQKTPSGAVVVMRDLSHALFTTGSVTVHAQGRLFRAAAQMHAEFVDNTVGGLCPLRAYYAFLSPSVCTRFVDEHEVPRLALEGWARFNEIIPTDVVETIASVHADPGPLVEALSRRASTLVHGDLKLANLGVDRERVIVLDWGTLTTWAPPVVDYAWYLAINAAGLGRDHDQLLDDMRAVEADGDEVAVGLALIGALAQLGWEKALGATADDPTTQQREREGLSWWVAQVRRALEGALGREPKGLGDGSL
jgi:hypothetical protein